jgi:hypothetical protein
VYRPLLLRPHIKRKSSLLKKKREAVAIKSQKESKIGGRGERKYRVERAGARKKINVEKGGSVQRRRCTRRRRNFS